MLVLFEFVCMSHCFSLIFSSSAASTSSAHLSKAFLDHNFFVFPDRSMIFGMWVHDHKAVCHVQ